MPEAAVFRHRLEGVADRVAEVQYSAQPRLPLVLFDDIAFDAAAIRDHGRQDARLTRKQPRHLRTHLIEERPVGDDAVLDDFVQARPELATRQRRQESRIDDHRGGLVVGADQVLPRGVVDADLSADCAVHLGQQRRRHLDDRNAAQIGSGREPGRVADDAAAGGDDRGGAIRRRANQRVVDAADRRELFEAFSVGKQDRVVSADAIERAGVQAPHGRIGHDESPLRRADRIEQRGELTCGPGGDVDRVGAGRRAHLEAKRARSSR